MHRCHVLRRALLAAGVVVAVGAAAPAAANAAWDGPFRVFGPTGIDLLPPQIAISSGGAAAIGSATFDAQEPAVGSAFVATRSQRAAGEIPGARRVLDVGFSPRGLELLVGVGLTGKPCCGSVALFRGRVGPRQAVVDGLTGTAEGKLVALRDGILAIVATPRALWVARTHGAGPLGRAHPLTELRNRPQTFEATALADGTSAVTWANGDNAEAARRIMLASAPGGSLPRRARIARVVPPGHVVEELAIAPGPGRLTLAWIESWVDRTGRFQSAAITADLGSRRARVLSSRYLLASSLSLVGDRQGDQIAVWSECPPAGIPCLARAARRRAPRAFGRPVRLGQIDAAEAPRAAMGQAGEAAIGWITGGRVVAATRDSVSARLRRRTISRSSAASNLELAFGRAGAAIAAWTQGTSTQSIYSATYRSG